MIDLFKVYIPGEKLGYDYEDILRSGQLTSGLQVQQFEKLLQDYIGNPYVMVTGSNTYSSLIALALCGLKNDDEVIASPMSCLASNQPVLNFGAKLIWGDIDPRTGTLDPVDLKKKITSKTKVILHYHWGGYPGYVDEINAIGLAYGIPVIDDAIESFGSEYKGNKMGNLGTPMTIFSFQTVRLPNSIDGGAIAFNDEKLYLKALKMRDFGITRYSFRDDLGELSKYSDIDNLGYNAIMNEINASFGVKVMKNVPDLISLQRRNALVWDDYCNQMGNTLIGKRNETSPNYWIYSFLTNQQEEDLKFLRSRNYYASKVHLRNDYYSCFGKLRRDLMGVNEFEMKQLSVPSGWWVDPEDLNKQLYHV